MRVGFAARNHQAFERAIKGRALGAEEVVAGIDAEADPGDMRGRSGGNRQGRQARAGSNACPPRPGVRIINQRSRSHGRQVERGQGRSGGQQDFFAFTRRNSGRHAQRFAIRRRKMVAERAAPARAVAETRFDLLGQMAQNELEAPRPVPHQSFHHMLQKRAVGQRQQRDGHVLVQPVKCGILTRCDDDGYHCSLFDAANLCESARTRKTKFPTKYLRHMRRGSWAKR